MKSASVQRKILIVEYFGILCGIYSISGILFNGRVSAFLGAGVIAFLRFIIVPKLKVSRFLFWTIIMVSSVPMSFYSIIGVEYSRFPPTWFNLAIIALFYLSMKQGIRVSGSLVSLALFTIFFLVSELFSNGIGFFDAFKQYFNIALVLMTIVAADSLKRNFDAEEIWIVDTCYLCGVCSFAIIIILQYLQYHYLNISRGYFEVWVNRQSYAGTFSDFSFASTYLATGCLCVLLSLFDKKDNLIKLLSIECVLLIALLLVNARTGIMALIVAAGLYIAKELVQLKKYALPFTFLSVPLIVFIVEKTVTNRGGQSFLDGSGRGETYIEGLKTFFSKPFLGVGFGVSNYAEYTHATIPHNMIIQFLAQFGFVGSLILFLGIAQLIKVFLLSGDDRAKWMLMLSVVAGMLIPDIASSHYFSTLAFMAIIGKKSSAFEYQISHYKKKCQGNS